MHIYATLLHVLRRGEGAKCISILCPGAICVMGGESRLNAYISGVHVLHVFWGRGEGG